MSDSKYIVSQVALNTFYIYENPHKRTDSERIAEMESITETSNHLSLPDWTVFEEPEYEGEPQCRVDTKTRINVVVPRGDDPFDLLNDHLEFKGWDPHMGAFESELDDFSGEIHLDCRDL